MIEVSNAADALADWMSVYRHPGLGPFFGAILAAVVAAAFGFFIVHQHARRLKQSEATLEFSKRFQTLLEQQHRLNAKFYCEEESGKLKCPSPAPSAKDELDAWNLFRQFFDLMLNEFSYFQAGVIHADVFADWMLWRWYDWDPARARRDGDVTPRPGGLDIPSLEICGASYRTGWAWWIQRPVVTDTSFVNFMNALHDARDEAAARRIVKDWAPRQRRSG